ncbi:MAG: type IX secretion system membrane protein PorP/SprF, partial [Bacteroidota bacterium]
MKKVLTICYLFLLLQLPVMAQNNFFSSSVFENKVVFNPSQSGLGGALRLNGVFRSPMNNSQPGLAKEYAASADMPISETAGIGLIMT